MSSAEAEFGNEQVRDEAWRDEVASRLNTYRARRRRGGDDHSMRLDFEAEAPARETRRADTDFYRRANAALEQPASVDVPLVHAKADEQQTSDAEWLYTGAPAESRNENPDYDPDFDFNQPRVFEAVETPEPPRPESNLIVFPRVLSIEIPKPLKDELAEPVIDRPRILDVPEEITPTIEGPLFAQVELDPEEESDQVSARAPEYDIPLQVALVPMRAYAAMVDLLLVTIACAVFGTIVWNTIPNIPHTKATFAAAMVTLALFWSVYNYLFLVYCGRTVGMDMARLMVVNFEGELPTWKERQRRAFAMVLSFASVGLGFAWAFVDPDMLCWHDRISGTYVAQR